MLGIADESGVDQAAQGSEGLRLVLLSEALASR